MANSPSFHSFTFENGVHSGAILKSEPTKDGLNVTYEYHYKGVRVEGVLRADRKIEGGLSGGWTETPDSPIDGEKRWEGSSVLSEVVTHGRRTLVGTWTMRGVHERWVIDLEA